MSDSTNNFSPEAERTLPRTVAICKAIVALSDCLSAEAIGWETALRMMKELSDEASERAGLDFVRRAFESYAKEMPRPPTSHAREDAPPPVVPPPRAALRAPVMQLKDDPPGCETFADHKKGRTKLVILLVELLRGDATKRSDLFPALRSYKAFQNSSTKQCVTDYTRKAEQLGFIGSTGSRRSLRYFILNNSGIRSVADAVAAVSFVDGSHKVFAK